MIPQIFILLNENIIPIRNKLPAIPMSKVTLLRDSQPLINCTKKLFVHFFNFNKFEINDLEVLIASSNEKRQDVLNIH